MRLTVLAVLTLSLALTRHASGFYAQPQAVHFIQSPSHVTTCLGCGPIVLSCMIAHQTTAADLPLPELLWTVNGTTITELIPDAQIVTSGITSQLTLSDPQLSHNGLYRCVARDGEGSTICVPSAFDCVPAHTLSNSARVQVFADSVFSSEVVYTAGCGSTRLLSCGFPSDSVTPSFRWRRDGLEVNNSTEYEWVLPNGDLLVRSHGNLSVTNTYSCLAEFHVSNGNRYNITTSQYELHTNTLTNTTSIELTSQNNVYSGGDNIELVCSFSERTSCDSSPHLTWYFNNMTINSDQLVFSGHVLRLEDVSVMDSGVYCCHGNLGGEVRQACTSVYVIERAVNKDLYPTLFVEHSLVNATLETADPSDYLIWYYNGLQLEDYNGLSSLLLPISLDADLYGVYQCFIEGRGGVQTQVSLTRVMPYGRSNPPGPLTFTEVPRAGTPLSKYAVRVEWTEPTYTGGSISPQFNVLYNGDRPEPLAKNNAVIELRKFHTVTIRVAVVTGVERVSDYSVNNYFSYGTCTGDKAKSPPELTLECINGQATLSWGGAGSSVYYHRTGGCVHLNNSLPLTTVSPLSYLFESELAEVGTRCSFEVAAAAGNFDTCQGSECQCYDPSNLEFSQPIHCNISVSVEFDQSEYTVEEGDSMVEICATARGYGFSVVMDTIAVTATADRDFLSLTEEVVFTSAADNKICVNLTILDDKLVEKKETLRISMTTDNPDVHVRVSSTMVVILDNDYVNASVTLGSPESSENDSSIFICVGVAGELAREVVLTLDTINGTALEGTDFDELHIEVHLNETTPTSCVPVYVIDDLAVEEGEYLTITLNSSDPGVEVVSESVNVTILDNDYVTVSFTDNDTLSLPANVTSIEICVQAHGYLEREITVVMDTPGEDVSLIFNQTVSVVCVSRTIEQRETHISLVSSDVGVRVVGGALLLVVVGNNLPPSNESSLTTADSAILGVVGCLVLGILVLILLCVAVARRRRAKLRYEKQIRIGLQKSESLMSNFQDPVTIGTDPHQFDPDELTQYNQFYPSGSFLMSASSLSLSKVRDSRLNLSTEGEVTNEQILEHLQQYSLITDYFQKDSGICEYTDSSAFSGRSTSSYVHCNQCNCTCGTCTASREGKSPKTVELADQKSICDEPPEDDDPLQFVSLPSSTSLPELRSCDHHMTPQGTLSLSSELLH